MKSLLVAAALVLGMSAAHAQPTPPGDGVTQQGTHPEGQPCTPPGYNAGASSYPPCSGAAPAARPQSQPNPPACSRTVTDHCIQTYERGVRRPR